MSKPPIWGTHLRWMALCPVAWRLVVDGLMPLHYSTPPIVGECGRKQHDALLKVVRNYFDLLRNNRVIATDFNPKLEYSVRVGDEFRPLILKPDLYLLVSLEGEVVNITVEVTTRALPTIPVEWLAAYSLGFYVLNMQPSVTLLVTPAEVKVLPLSTSLTWRLERLLSVPPRRRPASWLCSNCDLRPVCPEPLA